MPTKIVAITLNSSFSIFCQFLHKGSIESFLVSRRGNQRLFKQKLPSLSISCKKRANKKQENREKKLKLQQFAKKRFSI